MEYFMGAPRKHPPNGAAEVIQRMAAEGHAIIGIAKHLGVSRETFKRWCEESESLQEAFEIGRETERQALHALIVQSAVANKPANVNAFFILKARHGYRDNDSPNSKVDVSVAVATNVLVVKDHGTDEQWAAKAAEQQRRLSAPETAGGPLLEAPRVDAPEPYAPLPEADAVLVTPSYHPPAWKARA
jgi:hypothetical protein